MYDWISKFRSVINSIDWIREQLTNIDVIEPSQIKSCSDEILDSLSEDNMAAIVAVMKGIQNIFRIICYAVIMALHVAHPIARGRRWWWLGWRLWVTGD